MKKEAKKYLWQSQRYFFIYPNIFPTELLSSEEEPLSEPEELSSEEDSEDSEDSEEDSEEDSSGGS